MRPFYTSTCQWNIATDHRIVCRLPNISCFAKTITSFTSVRPCSAVSGSIGTHRVGSPGTVYIVRRIGIWCASVCLLRSRGPLKSSRPPLSIRGRQRHAVRRRRYVRAAPQSSLLLPQSFRSFCPTKFRKFHASKCR